MAREKLVRDYQKRGYHGKTYVDYLRDAGYSEEQIRYIMSGRYGDITEEEQLEIRADNPNPIGSRAFNPGSLSTE